MPAARRTPISPSCSGNSTSAFASGRIIPNTVIRTSGRALRALPRPLPETRPRTLPSGISWRSLAATIGFASPGRVPAVPAFANDLAHNRARSPLHLDENLGNVDGDHAIEEERQAAVQQYDGHHRTPTLNGHAVQQLLRNDPRRVDEGHCRKHDAGDRDREKRACRVG